MTEQELAKVLAEESNSMEWKAGGDPEKIVKTLTAYANDYEEAGSGIVVCGVEEVKDLDGRSTAKVVGISEGASRKLRDRIFDRVVMRQLAKSPGFAITAVLMLAFGIGATTAIFSIVEAVLLRPLPFPDSERLMVLADRLAGVNVGGNGEVGVTVPDIQAYTRETHGFSRAGRIPGMRGMSCREPANRRR